MEEKEQYTFEELCEGLEMSMSKFSKRADVDEGTIARIRKGHLARRGTINSLLRAFSEVYGIKFTTENVTGLKKVEKPIAPIDEKVAVHPIEEKPIPARVKSEDAPIRNVVAKRGYARRKDSGLPDGCMPATEFGLAHGVKRETFRDHMREGLGLGLIHGPDVPEDGSVKVKDYVRHEERNKRVLKDGRIEKEKYLTSDQQHGAIQFWRRHDVTFTECDQAGCPCHK